MTPGVEQIMDCMESPAKARIVALLGEKGKATPGQLLAAAGIPQATLYRSLKSLEAAGIVEVVSETRVRALTEKTFALTAGFAGMERSLVEANDGEAYYRLFHGFVVSLLKRFADYAKRPDIDIGADGSGFNATPLYATPEQLAECSRQIMEVLAPYAARTGDRQRQYTLATIITPPIDREDG